MCLPKAPRRGHQRNSLGERIDVVSLQVSISEAMNDQRLATAEAGPTFVEFIQKLRTYFVQEFARGREVDQIFDELEGSYGRLEKALRKP